MPSRSTFPATDAEHETEAAQQLQIAEDLAPVVEPTVDPAPEDPQVTTIKTVDVPAEDYPVHVGVVGAPEGEYTFTDASVTFEVPLEVAEQFTYMPYVEVVA